jgi:hypothetical protein
MASRVAAIQVMDISDTGECRARIGIGAALGLPMPATLAQQFRICNTFAPDHRHQLSHHVHRRSLARLTRLSTAPVWWEWTRC